jgi:hypothetical protein
MKSSASETLYQFNKVVPASGGRAGPFTNYDVASSEMSLTGTVVAACIAAATGISLAIFSHYVSIKDKKQAKLDADVREQQDLYQRLLAYLEKLIYERSKLIGTTLWYLVGGSGRGR